MPSIRSLLLLSTGLTLAACGFGSGAGPDGSSPLVQINAPTANATVSGQVPIDITAMDDSRVDKVRILIDGVELTTMFTAPFHTLWNSQSVTNTSHAIRAEASDVAGNVGTFEITVTVSNGAQAPPAVPQ
jgi:hypothetical protein